MIERPSTSHRTGSLVSATHQLWSSPRRTTVQSRVHVALAIVKRRGYNFWRSVRGEVEKTSTKKHSVGNGRAIRTNRGKSFGVRRLALQGHLLFDRSFSVSACHGMVLREDSPSRAV